MVTPGRCLRRSLLFAFVALAILTASAAPARAQYFGYGMGYPAFGYAGYGYGYPSFGYAGYGYGGYPMMGYGYGYGYPGYSYGYPMMGYGYGGLGYGGYAGYGFGYPGLASPFGYPALGYGYSAFGGYGYPAYLSGLFNPLFGVGMTPLGLQSYLYERNVLGRGLTNYSSGYSGYTYTPGATATTTPGTTNVLIRP